MKKKKNRMRKTAKRSTEEIQKLTKKLVKNSSDDLKLVVLKDLHGLLGKSSVPFAHQDGCLLLLNELILGLQSQNEDILLEVLSILQRFVADSEFTKSFSNEPTAQILQNVVDLIAHSKHPAVAQKALNLLANQQFDHVVIEEFVDSFLQAVCHSLSAAAEESIASISRLLEQCSKKMEQHILGWAKPLLMLSASDEFSCRQLAVTALNANLEVLVKNRKDIISGCAVVLKQDVFPRLKPLSSTEAGLQEVLTLQLPFYMALVGEYFQKSSSLINALLLFVEKGFRHTEDKVKLNAFKAWSCFIQSLASNKDLLSSAKYIKLLTQPFKMNLKSKELIKARVVTMWKLAVCLDDRLPDLFEMICKPLLEICFNGAASNLKRRSSNRLSGIFSPNHAPDKEMQLLGAEILVHLLLDVNDVNYAFALNQGNLSNPFMSTPVNFSRFHELLIPAVSHVICNLSQSVPKDLHTGMWRVMLTSAQECAARKRNTELVRSLFQVASQIVNNSTLPPKLLLEFVSSLTEFPNKVLNSNLHCTSGKQIGLMHDTPVSSIFELLVSPPIASSCLDNPDFLRCAEAVVSCGMQRALATLEFVNAVMKLLSVKHATYLRVWKILADSVLEHVKQTSNVNQGDSLEHDFSSMYSLVMFPLQFVLKSDCRCDDFIDQVISSWSALSEKFFALAALVETAEPEEARCHIAARALHKLSANSEQFHDSVTNSFLTALVTSLVKGAQFQGKTRYKKRLVKSMLKNDDSDFSDVIIKLIKHLSMQDPPPPRQSCGASVNVFPALLEVFSNLPQSLVPEFLVSLAALIQAALPADSEMVELYQKDVEAFWTQLTLRLPYSSSLVEDNTFCDIIMTAFRESTATVAQRTAEFWEMKALDAFDHTTAPEDLLIVLSDVYKDRGFEITWNEAKDLENAKFNVSVTSNQSGYEEEPDREVVEESLSVDDDTGADDSMESDDITQLTNDSGPSPVRAERALKNNSESSPDSVENRSVNLRKLASSIAKCNDQSASTTSDTSIRNSRSGSIEQSIYKSPPTSPVKNDSTKVFADADESIYEAVEMAEVSINDQSLPSDRFSSIPVSHRSTAVGDLDKDVQEQAEATDASEFHAKSDGCAAEDSDVVEKSVYEFVEMAEMSLNASPLSKSVAEDAQVEKSFYEHVEMAEMSVNQSQSSKCDASASGEEEDSQAVEASVYELVEMAEMSVSQSPLAEKSASELDESLGDDGDKSDYELVEMAEMSVNQTLPCEESSAEITDIDSCNDRSVYEEVEMAELSINQAQADVSTQQASDASTIEYESASERSPQKVSVVVDDDKDGVRDKNFCECDTSVTKQSTSGVFSEEANETTRNQCSGKQPAGDDDAHQATANDVAATVKPNEPDNSIAEQYAQDLGVQPLDCSFEAEEAGTMGQSSSKTAKESFVNDSPTPGDASLASPVEDDVTRAATSEKRHSTPRSITSTRRSSRTRSPSAKLLCLLADDREQSLSPSKSHHAEEDALENPNPATVQNDASADNCVENEVDRSSSQSAADTAQRDLVGSVSPTVVLTKVDVNLNKEVIEPDRPVSCKETSESANEPKPAAEQASAEEKFESPQAPEKAPEAADTPVSCPRNRLALLREQAALSPLSPNGILKRRLTDFPSPATNKLRRVSFAEPISTSSGQPDEEMIPLSPDSSPHGEWRKNKTNRRIVNRRLSLPAPKRQSRSDDVRSLLSVRSAAVAAAIADIKARSTEANGGDQMSPSRRPSGSPESASPVRGSHQIRKTTISQLSDIDYLNSLSANELSQLVETVLQAMPAAHSILIQKLTKR